MQNFEGRVAVVTGGASGVGKAICSRLAERGAHIVIVDIDPTRIELARAAIDGLGPGRVLGLACDVTREEQLRALADQVFA